jgi:ATP-dependent exoDNAse (exonuclease V) alpha subunit
MIGTRQLARVPEAADTAHAKVVLVGDPEQLQAIEAGAAFRGILAQTGFAELTEVHRQKHAWQREATQQLASAQTKNALTAYEREGGVVQLPTREAARAALLERWAKDGELAPTSSRIMLAYTRDDVRALNELARTWRHERGELGHSETIETERGVKAFATGERIYFLRNEKSLGVKNGSLATVEEVKDGILQVKLDHREDRLTVDTRLYRDLDYGYAATVYKAQGATVDRSYTLATYHYDRHSTYVALSRHREAATVFYGAEDFHHAYTHEAGSERARERFFSALSRARPKELAHDYLERAAPERAQEIGHAWAHDFTFDDIVKARKQAAMRWLELHEQGAFEPSAEHQRGLARERSHSRDGPELSLHL